MANFRTDSRIVLTLDASGTTMMFGAMQSGEFIVDPIITASNAHDLDLCLQTMVNGFRTIREQLDREPVAISFAFPGPADYPNGTPDWEVMLIPATRPCNAPNTLLLPVLTNSSDETDERAPVRSLRETSP